MITFAILVFILLILIAFMVLMVSLFGAGFIIVFGDLIVCIAIIVLIIRHKINKKKKDE